MRQQNVILDLPLDKLREECGLFGIFEHKNATYFTIYGLHALQHRGQEAAGIAGFAQDGTFAIHRALGLVNDHFSEDSNPLLDKNLVSTIGHVRYSTAGTKTAQNIQPLTAQTRYGQLAIAHNGNLTNAATLREQLIREGRNFQTSSDTEVILHLLALSEEADLPTALMSALDRLEGAFSLLVLTENCMIALRDPAGVRPLVLGKIDGRWIATSETCALHIMDAEFVRDVKPGELVMISRDGEQSFDLKTKKPNRFCIFEYIYFMRPNSFFGGKYVSNIRERIGAELFRESHTPADIIIPVPDGGTHAAVGYAETANIPFKQGIIRSHYVGRTFIEPSDKIRHFGVKMKLSVNKASVLGRRVILIDDSIVRSTTMTKIVDMVRKAGAIEVHVRIASPPFIHPCYYGIDIPRREELVAANATIDDIREMVGADSLAYISLDGLYKAVSNAKRDNPKREYCDACFTGDYELALTDRDEELKGKVC